MKQPKINEFVERLLIAITDKTGWGKNELKERIERELSLYLLECLEE